MIVPCMHFSKSLQGSKWSLIMHPPLIESALLFLPTWNFLDVPKFTKYFIWKSE